MNKKILIIPVLAFVIYGIYKFVLPKLTNKNKVETSVTPLKKNNGVKKTNYQKSSEETVEEKIQNLKGRIRVNSRDYKAYFQLGEIYSQQGDDALTFIYFRKAAAISPYSEEGKGSLKWIKFQREQAKAVWFNKIGALYQQIAQVEQIDFDEKLKDINEKVESDFKTKKSTQKKLQDNALQENAPPAPVYSDKYCNGDEECKKNVKKINDNLHTPLKTPSYMLEPVTPLSPTTQPK